MTLFLGCLLTVSMTVVDRRRSGGKWITCKKIHGGLCTLLFDFHL